MDVLFLFGVAMSLYSGYKHRGHKGVAANALKIGGAALVNQAVDVLIPNTPTK